ncbi:DUF3039 domain-containing protein [Rhodococcus erythropolis]|uniref:DUF3039 domain-containing protein n=1 Tax=Rhodococcus erythropolis TaxID=1833 RepID=UPI003672FF4A
MTEGLVVGPAAATAGDETFTESNSYQEIQMSISITPNGQNSQSDPRDFLHYVRSSSLMSSIVDGTMSTALCGVSDVFGSAGSGSGGGGSSICPTCALLYGALAVKRERAVAR